MSQRRGCEPCRSSRIHCDSQRPICGQCQANRVACTYGDEPGNFTFVDQNDAAALASRRATSRRSRGLTTIRLDPALLETRQASIPGPSQQISSATPILRTLDDRVLQRFFARWTARLTCLGCLDDMPQMVEGSAGDSAMRGAILATAYADLAVSERHGDLGNASRKAYSKTLRRLRNELSAPNFNASDDILAAVLAVDVFELLFLGRTEPLGVHTSAIVRLLELRKKNTWESHHSYVLWRSAYQRIYVRHLFSNIPTFNSADSFGFETDGRTEVRTIKFVGHVLKTMALLRTERAKSAEPASHEEIARLCTTLRMMVRNVAIRSADAMIMPQPERARLNNSPQPGFPHVFPRNPAAVYDNVETARDRLLFLACSIKVFDTLIQVRAEEFTHQQSDGKDVDRARDLLLNAHQDMADLQQACRSILDLVPFFVGRVDPHGNFEVSASTLNDTGVLTVKSPLRTVQQIEYVSQEMKDEAQAMLSFFDAHRHVLIA